MQIWLKSVDGEINEEGCKNGGWREIDGELDVESWMERGGLREMD
jgi:hypothetical protein